MSNSLETAKAYENDSKTYSKDSLYQGLGAVVNSMSAGIAGFQSTSIFLENQASVYGVSFAMLSMVNLGCAIKMIRQTQSFARKAGAFDQLALQQHHLPDQPSTDPIT